MIIDIKNATTRKQKRRLSNIAHFLAEHMIPAKTRDKLFLTVTILNDLGGDDVDGFTDLLHYDKDEIEIHVEVLRDLNEDEIVRTLAHEMVHVKQYACHQLVDAPSHHMKWKGELFPYDENAPWELEAYSLEHKLMDMINHYEQEIKTTN